MNGAFSDGRNGGGVKRMCRPLTGAPVGRGGTLRGGSVLGYESGVRALVGGAPLGAR